MDKKIQQTLQILEEYASEKKLINYSILYEQIKLNRENPSDRNKGAKILAEVNRITMKKNKTMLSAIVTLKGNESPAYGFYEFATKLKLLKESANEKDKLGFWAEQIKKVFKVYGKQ